MKLEEQGFEPWAFRMQSGRSATELHPLKLHRTRRATSTSPAAIKASHAANCARASALIATATRLRHGPAGGERTRELWGNPVRARALCG